MKPDKVVERFERVWKERDLFEREAPASAQSLEGEEKVEKGDAGLKLSEMMTGNSASQMPRVGDMTA